MFWYLSVLPYPTFSAHLWKFLTYIFIECPFTLVKGAGIFLELPLSAEYFVVMEIKPVRELFRIVNR